MVNNNFVASKVQRFALLAVFVSIGMSVSVATAQGPSYRNNAGRAYANQPRTADRFARAPQPVKTRKPQPFRIDVVDPPKANNTEAGLTSSEFPRSVALSRAFSSNEPRPVTASGRLQDVFGENPTNDAFGEGDVQPQPVSPFQKIEAARQAQDEPISPFSELTPRENAPRRWDSGRSQTSSRQRVHPEPKTK